MSYVWPLNTCCCGLFCHKQYQFIRHAIRVVGLYTKKARTAMPRFVNWWSWENLERKKGNNSAAHAYSMETAVPSSCVRDENFSGFQFTRISITLSISTMSVRNVANPRYKYNNYLQYSKYPDHLFWKILCLYPTSSPGRIYFVLCHKSGHSLPS